MLVAAAAMPSPTLASGDANQASCPRETESSSGFRAYLPDCRAYELVSPSYREGSLITSLSSGGDGSHLAGISFGAFSGTERDEARGTAGFGALYDFTRSEGNWQATPASPPASQYSEAALVDQSGTLTTSLWVLQEQGGEHALYVRGADGAFSRVGPVHPPGYPESAFALGIKYLYAGASSDLSHVVVTVLNRGSAEEPIPVWPGDESFARSPSLYEYTGTNDSEPKLVGVTNEGQLVSNTEAHLVSQCGVELGSRDTKYNAISANGSSVVFTALGECGAESHPPVNELFARVGDGRTTVALSEPSKADCAACNTTTELSEGVFQGASQDGERVFFTTSQELLPGHRGKNLYQYDVASSPGAKLVDVSGVAEPEVMGVVRVSRDGSHVYFVAGGILTSGANPEGREPVLGQPNLYVFDSNTEKTSFIATLASQAEAEEQALNACFAAFSEFSDIFPCFEAIYPANHIWAERDEKRQAETTPDGRFLAFASLARLTPDDSSATPQLFLYDSETGRITRVSAGATSATFPEGYNSDGNVKAPYIPTMRVPNDYWEADHQTEEGSTLSISGDGSYLFFEDAVALAPQAIDGFPNQFSGHFPGYRSVYEYHDGNVYLISDGHDLDEASIPGPFVGTDQSGQNILLQSVDPLVPESSDSQIALYDARIDGGPAPPPAGANCSGEGCRGLLAPSPSLASPQSSLQPGEAALPAAPGSGPTPKKVESKAQKLAKALKACHAKRNKTKRHACEKQARQKYGAKVAKKPKKEKAT
jgi:hypothetical protein